MNRPLVRGWLVAGLLLALSGCTRESQQGDTHVFQFALWVPISVLLGGLLAMLVGYLVRQKTEWGWVLLIGGPIAILIFAPGLWFDRATVNNERFTLTTGFWFSPTTHDVRFDDVQQLELVSEERYTRRGRQVSYYLVCHLKSGGTTRVPVGDLMKEGAAARIVRVALERGIPFNDRT